MEKPTVSNKVNLLGFAPLLQVFDIPTSLQFYRNILGFEVVQSSGEGDDVDWVLMKYADIEIMLNTAYEKDKRPAVPDTNRIESHQDTALYFGCPDTGSTYLLLLQKGMTLKPPFITGYGWKALEFKDPDGYLICLHWPETQ